MRVDAPRSLISEKKKHPLVGALFDTRALFDPHNNAVQVFYVEFSPEPRAVRARVVRDNDYTESRLVVSEFEGDWERGIDRARPLPSASPGITRVYVTAGTYPAQHRQFVVDFDGATGQWAPPVALDADMYPADAIDFKIEVVPMHRNHRVDAIVATSSDGMYVRTVEWK